MEVTFWGTRGSLPTPLGAAALRRKIVNAIVKANARDLVDTAAAEAFVDTELSFAEWGTYGGNSACVEVSTGSDDFFVMDLGSGAREFGLSALGRAKGRPRTYHFLMSHVHWDHVMGFPFVIPAYVPGNTIRIYGCHRDLESAFRRQQSAPSFPVEFDQLRAAISFTVLEPGRDHEIAGFAVRPVKQMHGNDSFGYRLERDGKSLIYSTDSEHKPDDLAQMDSFVDFFRDADMVIFDAQYSLAEAVSLKEDWGHSSNIIGVELCHRANVKHLVMIHHEPTCDDARLDQILRETRRYEEIARSSAPLRVSSAYDGLVLSV